MIQPLFSSNHKLWRFITVHRQRLGQLVALWLVLRLATSLWAALVSPLHQSTLLEQALPLWPPAKPLALWLERVWLAPWLRRDAVNYVGIVLNGYRLDDGSTQFHPLYLWSAGPIFRLVGHPLLALLIVSAVATILLLIVFEQLAQMDMPPEAARTATVLFLLAPPAFVFFAAYTESLFLLWTVVCFWFARKQRWWLAGLAGALATLTRQQGVLLVLPLAWELWEAADRDMGRAISGWPRWAALGLIPGGLLLWIGYRAFGLGDVQPDYSSLQAFVYSVVISPASSKVVPVQAFWWPWQALRVALTKLWTDFPLALAVDLGLAAGFLALLALAWKPLRPSYRLYSLAIVFISFAYHTGPFFPYMGLPRHLLLAFPVFIGLGVVVQRSWQRLALVGFSALGLAFLLLLYVIRGWVP